MEEAWHNYAAQQSNPEAQTGVREKSRVSTPQDGQAMRQLCRS